MIRIGQLGAGRIGRLHARNAAAHPKLHLAYIVDPNGPAAQALAQETGAEACGIDRVLEDETVDRVVITSSTDQHLADTLRALRAGKGVFCEKPLDLSLTALQAHAADFEAASARLFVAFNRRFDPHLLALERRLNEGAVGELETLHIISHDPAPPPPGFAATSGGLFKDFTIHDFDTARWLLREEPVEVFAWASALFDPAICEAGDVDTAKVVLRTAAGRLCVISNSRRSGFGYDQRVEAFGQRGMVCTENLTDSSVSLWRSEGALKAPLPYTFVQRYAEAYAAEMDHFAQILDRSATPRTGYQASVRALALALAEAAQEAARTNMAATPRA